MPSFDVVSQIDYQEVLNAINGVQREIGNRYDFKNVKWSIDLDKKENVVKLIEFDGKQHFQEAGSYYNENG